MRILVLGSSGTTGAALGPKLAWPGKLGVALREAGYDAVIDNYAMAGLPMAAFAERLLLLADQPRPAFCLVQLPIPNRSYIGINGQQQIREADLPRWKVFGMASATSPARGPAVTRLMLSPAIATPDSPFYQQMLRFHVPKVERNATADDAADYLVFLRFWDRNIATADLTYVQHAKEILFLQWVLERMSIPYGMFDWRDANVLTEPRGTPFCHSLNRDAFVGGGERNCWEFLQERFGPGNEDYRLDEWGHLTEAGNDYVAREFVLPWLLPRLASANGIGRIATLHPAALPALPASLPAAVPAGACAQVNSG
jgi:hypothetical protein